MQTSCRSFSLGKYYRFDSYCTPRAQGEWGIGSELTLKKNHWEERLSPFLQPQ